MLDINKNGKLDPEEKALEDVLANEAGSRRNKESYRFLTWAGIAFGILLIVMIIGLLILAK